MNHILGVNTSDTINQLRENLEVLCSVRFASLFNESLEVSTLTELHLNKKIDREVLLI
jgi:hypothetical protein